VVDAPFHTIILYCGSDPDEQVVLVSDFEMAEFWKGNGNSASFAREILLPLVNVQCGMNVCLSRHRWSWILGFDPSGLGVDSAPQVRVVEVVETWTVRRYRFR
jgi:hypothetical protein